MSEPQIGDTFQSPPNEYIRTVRIIGREGDRYLVENIYTKRKSRLSWVTLRRFQPVQVAAQGDQK